MTQPKITTLAAAGAAATGVSSDPTRIEQLLALASDLLLGSRDLETLAGRIAQRAAMFLGTDGAAVGVVHEGRYRLLAAYVLPSEYAARYEGVAAGDPRLAATLTERRMLVLTEPDGHETVLLPFPAGDPAGALHLVRRADRPLAVRDLELAQVVTLVAAVALANARQYRRAADLARWKGDALTAMAHDLRAPLNALVGYASLLGEDVYGPLTAEQREISATLERQAHELVDLLGATLDVARLETSELPIRVEDFSLGDLLAGLRAGTFARAARDGRLVEHLPADLPRLRSDRVKVKEIVQNLIDNALRHGGRRVEVEVALSGRDTVHITVRDSGPGIAADVLPRLFEPAPAVAGRRTGFGLYLVRSFAEALGGRVAARSVPGEGTAITVELPLAPEPASPGRRWLETPP